MIDSIWKKEPEQCCAKEEKPKSFADLVKSDLKKYGWKQKELAKQIGITESTMSRILKNKDGRGNSYPLTDELVAAIVITLQVGELRYDEYLHAAFPERVVWRRLIRERKGIVRANIELKELGLPELPSEKLDEELDEEF